MRRMLAVLALVGTVTSPAWADGFRSYRVCGGDTFATCAAVEINVVGSNVTVRMWNLDQNLVATNGNAAGTRGGAVMDGIGFYNLPAGLLVNEGSLSVSGPIRSGDNSASAAAAWNLKNQGSVAFDTRFRAAVGKDGNGGIASGCASGAQLPGSPPNLYLNPCTNINASGWVTFNFTTNGVAWDPNTSAISLRFHDLKADSVSECWTMQTPGGQPANCLAFTTTTPEPVTMTLLASGLVGMGGAGFLRRRRNQDQLS